MSRGEADPFKPKLYGLVVGVSDYNDPAMKLTYAAKDARDFDKALKGQKGAYYVDVETRVLTDREASTAIEHHGRRSVTWFEDHR